MSEKLYISAFKASLIYPKPHGITLKKFKINSHNTIIHSIKPFSLNIYSGDRIGVLGENGAGKTTLLRMLSGIYLPNSGSINLYTKVNPVIDSTLGFDQFASARQNIVMRCRLDGITSNKEILKIVDDIESFTKLGNQFDHPIYTYSTGMFFRVAFAYATRNISACAIIDELIGSGDLYFAEKAHIRMDNFLKSSSTLIMSSHSIDLLKSYCNSGIYVKDGTVYLHKYIQSAIDQYKYDVEKKL